MTQQIIRIRAAILDTKNLTLYREDGEPIVIKQGDPRLKKILDSAIPQIQEKGYADVDVHSVTVNAYTDFEKQSNGVVRFFRVAKEKIASLFGTKEHDEDQKVSAMTDAQTRDAIEDIMAHAIPTTDARFSEDGLNTQEPIVDGTHSNGDVKTPKEHTSTSSAETMVAVVGGKMIPGVEKIKNQFSRAAALGSTQGVENFLKRLGAVIHERKHSVDDLLKFMERADMPIADDGSIIIFKVLRTKDDVYVDCHTGKVKQWVGAYVCMDPSLVDPNRRNECSNGLHVARRGYIREFSGDVCTIGKLAPEDVIAVPEYDANKMRVCGYHILGELTPAQHNLLRNGKPITDDPDGAVLLGNVMRGNHIAKTDVVEITGNHGEGVRVKNLIPKKTVPMPTAEPAQALKDDPLLIDAPADPNEVQRKVTNLSRRDQAVKLSQEFEANPCQQTYDALIAFKRSSKTSWEKLGITEPMDPAKFDFSPPEPEPEPEPEPVAAEPLTNRERVQALLPVTTKAQAEAVLAIKRQCKKSWEHLGVSETDMANIYTLIG